MKLHRLQPRTDEPPPEFPPLSLEPPSLMLVPPPPVLEPPPETTHDEPDWRGRTARSQYLESEIYQPLSSLLIGARTLRVALLIAVLLVYTAVIGWFAWDAWSAAHTTPGQAVVAAVVAGGALAGWVAEVVERRLRLRRRFAPRPTETGP